MSDNLTHPFASAKADGGDATLVRPGNWNATHKLAQKKLNSSGAQRVAGDVTVLDATTDDSIVGISTAGSIRPAYVVTDATINNGAQGNTQVVGEPTVNVQGAVTRGDFLRMSATAQKAEDTGVAATGSVPPPGAFAIALTGFAGPGAGSVVALMLQPIMYDGAYGLRGFQGDPNGASPNTKYDLTKANSIELRAPNGGVYVVKNAGSITNDTGLDNTNANGRDQAGTFGASTWIHFYYVLAITGPGVGVVRSRSSLTAPPTGPTLATGEIAWAYAGAVRYDGSSHLVKTYMRGNTAFYDDLQAILSQTFNLDGTEQTGNLTTTVIPPNALRSTVIFYQTQYRSDFGPKIRLATGGGSFWAPLNFSVVDTAMSPNWYINFPHPLPTADTLYFFYANVGGTATAKLSVTSYVMPNGGE